MEKTEKRAMIANDKREKGGRENEVKPETFYVIAFNCHTGENQAPRETEANHYIVITISLFVPNSRSGMNSVTSVHLAHAGLRGAH